MVYIEHERGVQGTCSWRAVDVQIDLKHYKSKRLALRWRTAPEVVEGIGGDTCGSLRCRHHRPQSKEVDDWSDDSEVERARRKRRKRDQGPPPLRAFELPFVYEEAGKRKEALVKVRLCGRCEAKLKWKPPIPGVDSEGLERRGGRDRRRVSGERHERDSRSASPQR